MTAHVKQGPFPTIDANSLRQTEKEMEGKSREGRKREERSGERRDGEGNLAN